MVEVRPGIRVFDIPQPVRERAFLAAEVVGQPEAVEEFAKLGQILKSPILPTQKGPLAVKILAGPSGTGKTTLGGAFAELLCEGASEKILTIDGTNYTKDNTESGLIGVERGLVGHHVKPLLSQENLDAHKFSYYDDAGNKRDIIIVQIDEFEKMHDEILKVLLPAWDDNDRKGGKIRLRDDSETDFSNVVFILTSNIGNKDVEDFRSKKAELTREEVQETYISAYKKRFLAELRGRIDDLIVFNHLDSEALQQIIPLQIKRIEKEFALSGVNIKIDLSAEVEALLVKDGYDPTTGARKLKQEMKKRIHNPLLSAARTENLRGKTIHVGVGSQPNSEFRFGVRVDLPDLPSGVPARIVKVPDRGSKIPDRDEEKSKEGQSHPPLPDEYFDYLKTIIFHKETRERGILGFSLARERLIHLGVTQEQIDKDPRLIELLKNYLQGQLQQGGRQSYCDETDTLVARGMHTHAFWNKKVLEDYAGQRTWH